MTSLFRFLHPGFFFFFNDTATTEIYTLSLHDALPITEEPEDGGYMFEGQPTGEDDPEAQLYRKAVQTVAESQKASTSYLQRQLRVGYNNAARLVERMEKDNIVSAPDHVGRREVLVDPEGRPL